MVKRKDSDSEQNTESLDFSEELIASLNKEFQTRVAYNLATTESPTHVKRWISTRSILLDYAIANHKGGGLPEGRICEISGEPSTGKSHLALNIARTVQEMGGIVVYIDSENAIMVERLAEMGIDVSKRFVYVCSNETEEIFQIAESTITKAKTMLKDVPVLIVWDSVAQTSPKMENEGTYEQQTMGLQARVISKGMRKITNVIGRNNVIFLCLNQTRTNINAGPFNDPTVVPGGKAIPFAASVRLSLTGGGPLKNSEGLVIGSKVNITVKKNKVGPPFKKMSLEILFGRGLNENESLYEILVEACKKGDVERDGKRYLIEGGGAWKTFKILKKLDFDSNEFTEYKSVKFTKNSFSEKVLNNDEYRSDILEMIDIVLVTDTSGDNPVSLSEDEND